MDRRRLGDGFAGSRSRRPVRTGGRWRQVITVGYGCQLSRPQARGRPAARAYARRIAASARAASRRPLASTPLKPRAVLDQAVPANAGRRRVTRDDWLVLLRTKEQNASTSTAVRLSQWPIVAHLWPVTSSGARRPPRRSTTSNARPISSRDVRSRYRGAR